MRLLYKAGPMESLRKWFYKPKRDDHSLLAQFFFADDALNLVAAELDSFDGRKDPDRCTTLVNQLRLAQDRVLNITSQIMDQVLGDERVARGFRVKFPEDVLQDNLAGQLWFGAECLAAGSSIINRDEESAAMRPLAKALTRSLETVRSLLREQCLRPRGLDVQHDEILHESLKIFDRLFAKFELCYVSAMVNVKTPHEFEAQQLICVLFSETLSRALKQGLLTQEQVDSYDPALMFAVPRLAIVSGLLIYSSGPLSIDKLPGDMSDMFRPFRALLHKIRTLLWTLERRELQALERLLATNEHLHDLQALHLTEESTPETSCPYPDIAEFVSRFYADHSHCKDVYSMQQSTSSQEISDNDYVPDNIDVMTPIIEGIKHVDNQELTQYQEPLEPIPEHSNEKCSQQTFQEQKSRKTSKTDSNDFSSLRNLSTSGLMMFDPLVLNAVSQASTSNENNWLSPDQNLVSSLNEQVSEIADRLSSIATIDTEISLENNQMHSFSTNDVPTLISTDCDNEAFGFTGNRNEQMSCLPSTSHGYLIPNAISQEPVILASLSHNNSAVFNPEDENNDNMNPDLSIMISDSNIEYEVVNTNITIANANLSSLLLTNEEFRQNFLEENLETPESEDVSFHSAKLSEVKNENEPVKFFLGYESDTNDISPGDSGVSTENTSLDRSPDSDQNKQVIKDNHYMQQNRVLQSDKVEVKNPLENSFSEQNENGDVTVNLSFVDDSVSEKNEASSSQCVDKQIDCKEKCDNNSKVSENEDINLNRNSSNDEERKKVRQKRNERDNPKRINDRSSEERSVDHSGPNTSSGRSKVKKSTSKIKKKKSKWSPAMVILDNRSTYQQNDIIKLNLDHFVNESNTSLDCADDEEIALALQAQELAARQQARSKFKSSEDLIHRLFVCIAGVADQLQTNFAADLRNILKSVFLMNQTPDKPDTPTPEEVLEGNEKVEPIEYEPTEDSVIRYGSSFDSVYSAEEVYADSSSDSTGSDGRRARTNTDTMTRDTDRRRNDGDERARIAASVSVGDLSEIPQSPPTVERAPEWVPDIAAPDCMRCAAHFTAFRRRHHCRNCGKVFCASCSSNSIPLPKFGQLKPVRVCEECFRAIADTCRRPTQNNQR